MCVGRIYGIIFTSDCSAPLTKAKKKKKKAILS